MAGRGGTANHSPNGADMPPPQQDTARIEPPLSAQLRAPGRANIELREYAHGEDTVLEVQGEVDLLTGPRLATHLNAALRRKHGNVIVDLRNVDFADSVCLKILLNAQIQLTRQSRRLAVLCGEGPVRRLIQLTRLLDTLGVIDDISKHGHAGLILDERQHH